MTFNKNCVLSNDVETTSIWFNTLSDETGLRVINEGMPILLDIYARYGIKSTFFIVGDMAQKWPEVVKMVSNAGHEVASHGWSHEVGQAFDVLSLDEQIRHLSKSKKLLEDISGQEVVSFRAPALRINKHTPIALTEAGYKYDSSVASQRFDMFMSFGSFRKMKWLIAPRKPYRTSPKSLIRRGTGSIVEIPLSALILPYTSTTLRIFPYLSSFQRRFVHLESTLSGKPVVFDIHPNEFIDESVQPREINRRAEHFVGYVLADLIRSRLKVKNLGYKCGTLYEREIQYFIKKKYSFYTIKDFGNKVIL